MSETKLNQPTGSDSAIWTYEHIVFSDCVGYTFWIYKDGEHMFDITDEYNTREYEKSEALAILVCESLNQNVEATRTCSAERERA